MMLEKVCVLELSNRKDADTAAFAIQEVLARIAPSFKVESRLSPDNMSRIAVWDTDTYEVRPEAVTAFLDGKE